MSMILTILALDDSEIDEVVGDPPPRFLRSERVAALDGALQAIGDDELADRFDPADMHAKEIYPGIWDRNPEEDDALGYLMEYVTILREFVGAAARQSRGLLIALE